MARAIYLRSRVARRLVLLFLVSALGPVTVLAGLAYRQVSRELSDQATANLRRESKVAAAMVMDRVMSARAQALEATQAYRAGRRAEVNPNHLPTLDWVGIESTAGGMTTLFGTPPAGLGLRAVDRDRLNSGRPWLGTTRGDRPTVVLGFLVDSSDSGLSGHSYLVAQVAPHHLWGTSQSGPIAPENVSLCIRTAERTPLFASDPTGCDHRPGNGVETVSGSQILFLGYEFGAPSWEVVTAQPASVVLDPIARFRTSFVLVILVTIGAVFILTNIQVRRTMSPLDSLIDGTQQIRRGRLEHVVAVTTDDEFKGLADSFNDMAGSLKHQFDFLQSLGELDRTALTDPRSESIRDAVLRSAALVLPDAQITVVACPSGSTAGWTATTTHSGGSTRVMPSPSEMELLQRGTPMAGTSADFPGLTVGVESHRTTHIIVPFQSGNQVHGALVISRDPAEPVDAERQRQCQLVAGQAALALASAANLERLDEMSWGSLTALARTIDAASPWTAGHSERVTRVAMALGNRLGLSESELETLHRGGLLHDIGKIGVPAEILDKPGQLTPEERAKVMEHPSIGARILAPVPVFQDAVPLVRWHHELLDGSGYPDRLAGDQIPKLVRIMTVADVFDALTSERPYRPAWPIEKTLAHFRERADTQFDGEVVRALEWLVTNADKTALAPLPTERGTRHSAARLERPEVAG